MSRLKLWFFLMLLGLAGIEALDREWLARAQNSGTVKTMEGGWPILPPPPDNPATP